MYRMFRDSRLPLPGFTVITVRQVLCGLIFTWALCPAVQGQPGSFAETFALAADRGATLGQLIPGTDLYFYFHSLAAQHQGDTARSGQLLQAWEEQIPDSELRDSIQCRQMLLGDPEAGAGVFERLIEEFSLTYSGVRVVPGEPPALPTHLDPDLISTETLGRAALAAGRDLGGFTDAGLWWLAQQQLSAAQERELLGRLQVPDAPNLVNRVVADLRSPQGAGFGALRVHGLLTLAQLEAAQNLMPELLQQAAFVGAVLARLAPHQDEDLERDLEARARYLERVLGFARRLGSAYNSVKVHALYHRLALERRLGRYDRELLLEYLGLPRQVGYAVPDDLRRSWAREKMAELSQVPAGLEMPAVGDDWELVRDHLLHFLTTDENPAAFARLLHSDLLRDLLVEAKITHGVGDLARWVALLDDPAAYERLEQRVDLDFAPTQEQCYRSDQPVVIELDVKNVPRLLVKVYAINALNVCRTTGKEVDAGIDLDGLVANHEWVHEYSEPAWRRVRRRFALPELDRPGTYIVEFMGGGMGSRAVIRKGRLRHTERLSAAGHVLRVFDAAWRPVTDARAWIGGREFRAAEDGAIVVPYSQQPGRRPMVLSDGDGPEAQATLESFQHLAERYALQGGCHVEPESLIAGQRAPLLVRTLLTLNGLPISIKLLEKVQLVVQARDLDGVNTRQEIADPVLVEGRELVHEFLTPPRLQELTVSLQGSVQSLSTGEPVAVRLQHTIQVNVVDSTDALASAHLVRERGGYSLELRGKSGEPRENLVASIALQLARFTSPVTVTLGSDAAGRIRLGTLEGVTELAAQLGDGSPPNVRRWKIRGGSIGAPAALRALAGQTLRVPYAGFADHLSPEAFAFFETRKASGARVPVLQADRIDRLALAGGFLELRELPIGDYLLLQKETGESIPVQVVEGQALGDQLIGERWVATRSNARPLQIVALEGTPEELRVRLAHAGAATRCHVMALRYEPTRSMAESLAVPLPDPTSRRVPAPLSEVLTGRTLSDEFRYVLDRRQRARYPGNMLTRPGLLLNPWARREAETVRVTGRSGGEWGARGRSGGDDAPESRVFYGAEAGGRGSGDVEIAPNLDFLPAPALCLANLTPDADGVVRIPRARLGGRSLVSVLALDGAQTVQRDLALDAQPFEPRDLTLRTGLNPEIPATEQKRVTTLAAGEVLRLDNATSTAFETYGTVASVYRLYLTLTQNPDLAEFAFIADWPQHSAQEQRALYARHACHELHLFLARKDPAFFADVVRPYLANKKERTFLDRYLLEEDLRGYLDLWAYRRLNTLEKILLAGRMPGEPAATSRFLADQVALVEPDREEWLRRFRTALQGRALEASATLGALDDKRTAAKDLQGSDQQFFAEGAVRPGLRFDDPQKASPPPGSPAPKPAAPPAESAAADRDDLARLEEDVERRRQVRRLHRETPPTQELAESQYYHLHPKDQGPELIPPRAFWTDYAAHVAAGGDRPFISSHLAEPTGSFAEMLAALAVLDLPFTATQPGPEVQGAVASLRAASPLVVFHQQVLPSTERLELPAMVAQRYFPRQDRFEMVGGERRARSLDGDELLTQTVIGCQVVVTNPSPVPQKLDLLLQIPGGALPVASGFVTRGQPIELDPFATRSIEYFFYFPRPGTYTHLPAQLARDAAFVAGAQGGTVTVVERPTRVDSSSWAVISQQGTDAEVLAFLDRANLESCDLMAIAWRLQEGAGYRALGPRLFELLRQRHHYDEALWTYGLLHRDEIVTREWLSHQDDFAARIGGWFASPLLSVDPIERGFLEHLEYDPYLQPRIHPLGSDRQIPNPLIAEQYQRFIEILCTRPVLTAEDHLAAASYLLLQDRIDEGLARLALVDRDQVDTRVQYDYLQAYAAFYSAQPDRARALAVGYQEHPVERWRERFTAVVRQLDEIQGTGAPGAPAGGVDDTTRLVATEPTFDLRVEAGAVMVNHAHLAELRVNYYPMDVELLFSSQPFQRVDASAGRPDPWSSIRPLRTDRIALPADGAPLTFALPEEFQDRNVIVEVLGGGKRLSRSHHASNLTVQFADSFGQLQVTSRATGRASGATYVKVYARRAGGREEFFKDGYTDLRGRFDYAALTVQDPEPVERFAVLVLHDTEGAVIQEVGPPLQ